MVDKAAATNRQLQHNTRISQIQSSWHPLLDESLSARAREVALVVAERMRDPDLIHALVEQVRQRSYFPIGWAPFGLGSGDAGVALMYEYFDRVFPGQGWDVLTRRYLAIAAAGSQQMDVVFPALFGGTSGMALILSLASRGGRRYQKTLASVHQGLCEQVLLRPWQRTEMDGGVASEDYDIISGAAGVLAYLISLEQPGEQIQVAIEHLLHYLTWLAEPGQPVGKERWYIPPMLLPNELHRQDTPQGNFNCGLAHGIPGPLAALALTHLAGYTYPGLREAIAYLANWIIEHRVDASWGPDWPSNISLEHALNPADWQHASPTRTAWCYGSPGIARSLWLAGQALDDEQIRQVAIEAFEGALRRPAESRRIISPHLCHGIAGLLQIALRFAHECESTLVREQLPLLTQQLLDTFDPASALGFCDRDEGEPLDQPAWLTGAAGVAMTLLAASTPLAPSWDRALGIA